MKKHLILLLITGFIAVSISGCDSKDIPQAEVSGTAVVQTAATEVEYAPPDKNASIWVPVIVYHHIEKVPQKGTSAFKSFFIEPQWFEKHLLYLKENNFTTVHFSDVADYFEIGKPLPERPVIISFDDGWRNGLENGLPLLEKYDMTATFFIPANLRQGKYMNWEELKRLRAAGMEIGSHSLWHPYLTRSKKAREEIFESKKIIEEKLGIPITTFAYPFGDYNETIENLVKEAGYTTGRSFTTGNGISRNNLFHIGVVRVYANVGLERWKSQLFPPTQPQ